MSQVAGILPAVVFPAATALQLIQMLRARSAAGVSVTTWALFGWANIALYVYAERYWEWQAIAGMLGTALLDFIIAGLAARSRRRTARVPLSDIPAAERIAEDELTEPVLPHLRREPSALRPPAGIGQTGRRR